MVGDDIRSLVDSQRQLENKFGSVMDKKGALDVSGAAATKTGQERQGEVRKEAQQAGGQLRNSTHVFARSLKQSPLTPDNLEKVQADR